MHGYRDLAFEPSSFSNSCLANEQVNESVCNLNAVNYISLEAYIQSFICESTVVVEILRCQFRRFCGDLGVARMVVWPAWW
jgi:hypothetical protein